MNTRSDISRPRCLPLIAALLAAFPTVAGAEIAGRFQFVGGDVRVIDTAGRERAPKKGDNLHEGDTIVTAPSASAQVLMIDKGFLAVRPDTRLKVDTFKYAGKEDGSERALVSLVRGGFRTITGAIGNLTSRTTNKSPGHHRHPRHRPRTHVHRAAGTGRESPGPARRLRQGQRRRGLYPHRAGHGKRRPESGGLRCRRQHGTDRAHHPARLLQGHPRAGGPQAGREEGGQGGGAGHHCRQGQGRGYLDQQRRGGD